MPSAIQRAEISILFRHPSKGFGRTTEPDSAEHPGAQRRVKGRVGPVRAFTAIRRRPLREFLIETASLVTPGRSVNCLITDDHELRELNRRFLRKDYATDVLSFPSAGNHAGELAISLDRAAEQAAAFGHSIEEELRILMLHGLLHLAGMDHETDSGEMARAEARWRKRLQLPPGLVERAHA
ncbi:MAG TPA: rRNA maturation RNase YbeY [Bryobacteraceae bacterium]|jgi:probable rRNA maturation factor